MRRPRGRPPKEKRDIVSVSSLVYAPIRPSGGRKKIYQTPQELADAVNKFFALNAEEERIPTLSRLVLYLGFREIKTFHDYGTYGDDFKEVVDQTLLAMQAWLEEALLNTKSNTIGVIFTLKNHYGWKDSRENNNKHEIEVIPREVMEQDLEHRIARIANRTGQEILDITPVESTDDSVAIRLDVPCERESNSAES